jgi:hypothetical protein
MPTKNFTIVSAAAREDDPLAGDMSYFRAHPAERSFTRSLSHAERTGAGQLPPGCQQVRIHRVGAATTLPAIHVREYLPPDQDWRFPVTPSAAQAKLATRRFAVTNLPTDDRAAHLALRTFLLALP